jgi:hypothetical protein
MSRSLFVSLLLSFLVSVPCFAAEIPDSLEPWEGWVLHNQEEKVCPPVFNSGNDHRCYWPTELLLDLDATGGRFDLNVTLYAKSWVSLPGGPRLWPQKVSVKNNPGTVTLRQGRPALFLPAGVYTIHGEFTWERLPESLPVPPASGLVHLTLDGSPVAFPDFRASRLWLKDQGGEVASAEDRLELQVYRRVDDMVPMRVTTRLEIDVAGRQREVLIGPVLPSASEGTQFIPVQLTSPITGKLENDGSLRLQVRPGHWVVEVVARSTVAVESLPVREVKAPWPSEEVWVFAAHTDLRLVEPGGLPAVDPRQTTLPEDWREFPAFLAKPGEALSLKLVRQGDADPAMDQISIKRELWLDFDGKGYTVQDVIQGTMSRTHRLEASEDLLLGRVNVSGEDMLITTRPGTDTKGVEVRRGQIRTVAASRMEGKVSRLRATGWDHDFTSASARINTPPGWEVLAVTGVDNRPRTWLQNWTLLDLFLLLIISIAAFRLLGPRTGAVALVALALSWHTAFAPRTIWLHILVAVALLRYLPEGRLKKAAKGYRALVLILLILTFIPFAVDQVRTAVYPQLENMGVLPMFGMAKSVSNVQRYDPNVQVGGALFEDDQVADQMAEPEAAATEKSSRKQKSFYRSSELFSLPSNTLLQSIDEGALVQTGPGLPGWYWDSINLSWNGPVNRGHEVNIYYLPPLANSVVKVVRVLLVGLLGLLLAGIKLPALRPAPSALLLLLALILVAPATPASANEFPSTDLLKELQTRLLEPPECLPDCAQTSRLRLEADPGTLRMRLEIHVMEEVAVPLPCTAAQWLPQTVRVDGKAAGALSRSGDGVLWVSLKRGIHQVVLEGKLSGRSTILIPLNLPVHRVEARVKGWALEGVHENGAADKQLQLTRIKQEKTSDMPTLEAEALPPFVLVDRSLLLGLEWRGLTRVRRISPPGTAVVLEVPLLSGESVITDGVRVKDGKVLVNMGPAQSSMTWESALEEAGNIDLLAPDVTGWVETWRAEVSPIWNMEQTDGINVIHRQDPRGVWAPVWRPWPGESVKLRITRPEGVPGSTFTVDTSQYLLKPGKHATDASLSFVARSSLGGQHIVGLPPGAELTEITIDGALQPIRPEGGNLTLPVSPGRQAYDIKWRLPEGVGARYSVPSTDLGVESVNQNIRVVMPRNRWVLLAGGPALGPAVLFWSFLAVVLLVAFGLGHTGLTPLAWWQWMLLGLGLTQVSLAGAAVIVGWLLVLGLRRRLPEELKADRFNALQVLLVLLTVVAAVALMAAIRKGLLGLPDMQVAGNGSTAYNLNWYADRVGGPTAAAWVFSVPLYVYRLLMLAWALWLASSLIGWLKWGWESFTTGGYWKQSSKLILPGFGRKKIVEKELDGDEMVELEE